MNIGINQKKYKKLEHYRAKILRYLFGIIAIGIGCSLFTVFDIDIAIEYFITIFTIPLFLLFVSVVCITIKMSMIIDNIVNNKSKILVARNIFEMNNLKGGNLKQYQFEYGTANNNISAFTQHPIASKYDHDVSSYRSSRSYLNNSANHSGRSTSITNPGSTTGYMGYSSYNSYLWHTK